MRNDPYNIKDAQQLKEDRGYTKCSYKNCDCWNNFVDETTYIECNVTGRKYKIRRDISCNSGNVIDDRLLKKEKFWIRTLVTQHYGLNSKHELNRKGDMTVES